MDAIHIRTHGLVDDECAALAEMSVYGLKGVAAAIAVKSLGVVSVLYYEESTSAEAILHAVRAAGFEAEVMHTELVATAC